MKISGNIPVPVKNIKHLFLLLWILFLVGSPLSGQGQRKREEPPPLRERIFFGGSFGLQIGTYTNIEINPIIGVWLLPRLAIAVGPGYEYLKYQNVQTDIFSARGYVQLVLLKDLDKFIPLGIHTGIVLHAEDELLNLDSEYWNNVSMRPSRFYVNSLLAGGGLSQQIGRKGSFNILFLWVLTSSGYDLYNNPEVRISFTF